MALLVSSLLCSCEEKEWIQHDIEKTPVYRVEGLKDITYVDFYEPNYPTVIALSGSAYKKYTSEEFAYTFDETTGEATITFQYVEKDGKSFTDEDGNVTKTDLFTKGTICGALYDAEGVQITDAAAAATFDANESMVAAAYTAVQSYVDPATDAEADAGTVTASVSVKITEVYVEPSYEREYIEHR